MPSKALKLPPYREDKENYGPAKEEFVTYIEEDVEEEGTSRDTGRTMRKCTSRDAKIFLCRPPCRQACQEGLSGGEAGPAAAQAGVDRPQHPARHERRGQAHRQVHHR